MRWNLKPKPDPKKVAAICDDLKVDEIIGGLLVQRGVENYEQARKFFRPELSDLHDPYLMKDMDKAVARVLSAIEHGERILVFGDYDVDGTTAVSLVSSYLKTLTPNVATYIPDRYNEGYGISILGIDYAFDNEMTLIIALDCGIKSIDKVAYANEKKIDFIICDHHRPGEKLPDAVAVLDPKRNDCNYPYGELCGCAIGFKLVHAIGISMGQTIEDLVPYLDLVAVATAADIVPMTGENRILAKFGLEVINSTPRPGIKALVHQIKKQELDITDVVFTIAPRINAAGRIKHGNEAVNLLITDNFESALEFAKEIEDYNSDRKELDKRITVEALAQIEENNEQERYSTVVFREDWHKGVIGIVASRLIETYYRPTLVFTKSGDRYAASARSVVGFDVYNALENCEEHLEQFGGHMYAAGLTLQAECYENFKNAFEQTVKESIQDHQRECCINVDCEINFDEISASTLRVLKQFEPFGPQNMHPVFLTKDLCDTGFGKKIGKSDEHLKLYVKQKDSGGVGAIGFGLGNKFSLTANRKKFDALYSIEENEFNGKKSVQLNLKDIR